MTGPLEPEGGRRKGLVATSTPDRHFAILAIDHIGSMAEAMRPDDPSAVTSEQIQEAKREIADGLRHQVSAILLDPHVSESSDSVRAAQSSMVGHVLGLEDGDYVSMESSPRLIEGWSVQRAVEIGADAVKIAFYFDPDGDTRAVERFVEEVSADCRLHDIPLFAEPLGVFRDPAQRRHVVVEAARRFSALGPDVLKLEFPEDVSVVDDEREWGEACAAVDEASSVPWTLLSAGEDFQRFCKMLGVACRSGASGFVVGRAVWREAVRGGSLDPAWMPAAASRLNELARVTQSLAQPWTDRVDAGNGAKSL